MSGAAPRPVLSFDGAWLAPSDADRLLATLLAAPFWRQEQITLFGRQVAQPRLSAWMGDPGAVYTYSGLTLAPIPWTPEVQALRRRLGDFDSVLLNLYRDGRDAMGFHADDEPELGPEPTIASVSLGAARRFLLKPRRAGVEARELSLTHGSLLVMSGSSQRDWVHGVPREAKVTSPRVNLTFRRIHR